MKKSPYIRIHRSDIDALIKLLKPLGYKVIKPPSNYVFSVRYPCVILDALNSVGNLAFYSSMLHITRYHELSVYKFVYIAANIKKVAPSINTRIYLLKL